MAYATSLVIAEGVAFFVSFAIALAVLQSEKGYSEIVVPRRICSGNDDEVTSRVALRRGDEPRWGKF
jgi:hypothetical protein